MDKISVVVIDDHPLFRQGVLDTFTIEPDIEILGQADDGDDGFQLIIDCLPQVAVVDVNLPGMNGLQIARRVIERKLATRVVLLTAYDDSHQQLHALQAGAAAYCTKDIRPEELVDVIKIVAQGQFFLGGQKMTLPMMKHWLTERIASMDQENVNNVEAYTPLSPREMEVLTYVTRGFSNKEIAGRLGISHQTVKNHVTAILRKIGVDDRTQATIYALQHGWVRLFSHEMESEELNSP